MNYKHNTHIHLHLITDVIDLGAGDGRKSLTPFLEGPASILFDPIHGEDLLVYFPSNLLHLLLIGHVTLNKHGLPSELLDFSNHELSRFFVDVDNGNVRTGFRQRQRIAPANAHSSTRNQSYFTVQFEKIQYSHLPLPSATPAMQECVFDL